MGNATGVLNQLTDAARARASSRPVRYGTVAPGDTHRQGDIYITALAGLPADVEPAVPNRQLAPGTSQGSRHCLDSLAGVTFYRRANPTPLDGPILVLAERRVFTHPEHGHVSWPPGVVQITYQRGYVEEQARRVQQVAQWAADDASLVHWIPSWAEEALNRVRD